MPVIHSPTAAPNNHPFPLKTRLTGTLRVHRSRVCQLVILAFVIILWTGPGRASEPEPPDWHQYTVPFYQTFPALNTGVRLSPPTSGAEAVATTHLRARSILQHFACGEENEFLRLATTISNHGTYDGLLTFVMAKLAWLRAPGYGECSGIFNVVYNQGNICDFVCAIPKPVLLGFDDFSTLHQQTFQGSCADPRTQASFTLPSSSEGEPSQFFRVKAEVPSDCLRTEINWVLRQIEKGDAQPGTDGLPCNITYLVSLSGGPNVFPTCGGNWDFQMKELVRILFLDRIGTGDPSLPAQLADDVRQHILDDLLVVDGGPGRDSYSWFDCGDNEDNTGTPQDREDDNSVGDDFLDSVGDTFTWFLKRLLLFVELVAVLAGTSGVGPTVGAVLASLPALDGGLLAGLGLGALLLGQIPETENHRLMIESTRFLKNQLIIEALGGGINAPHIFNKQEKVKAWLVGEFQTIAQHDFIEYNARPYDGFSLEALRNLADFSTDIDVRTGAQMLIEYSAARFAIGSNQGRRLPPYRRHFGVLDCLEGNPCPDETGPQQPPNKTAIEIFRGFTSGSGFGDSEVAYGLLFNGQTQQLPFGSIPDEAAGTLVAASTTRALATGFVQNPNIAELAINKNIPYFQQIHHDSYEAYSSSPTSLITAGGFQTDHAYKLSVPEPYKVLVTGILDALGKELQDFGAALPTTVMFTGAAIPNDDQGDGSKMALDHFIAFRGTQHDRHGEGGLDDNLCVFQNFACGTNMRIPNDLLQCLIHDPNHIGLHWYFLDSSICDGYKTGPRFFVAMYIICPQDVCRSDLQNAGAGFLEVIDNPSDPIGAFESKVIERNPPSPELANLGQGCLTSNGACTGHYHTMSTPVSHDLELALRGHQDDSNGTGIISVGGVPQKTLDQIPLAAAAGAFGISSSGNGAITITTGSQMLTLDFTDPTRPCRHFNGGPCVQGE